MKPSVILIALISLLMPSLPASAEGKRVQADAFKSVVKESPEFDPPPDINEYATDPLDRDMKQAEAVPNPLCGQKSSGQARISLSSPLGRRLGRYAESIRERIAQNWHTNGLDTARQRSVAIVSFTILRDGSVRNPRVVQSSGDVALDNTSLLAVYDANPLPALPPEVTDKFISAQFTFNLRGAASKVSDTGSKPDRDGNYAVGGDVYSPVVVSKVQPEYTQEARMAKLSGSVLLGLVVDETGMPRDVRVVRSLGMGLDEKAVEAVHQWRFCPGAKGGVPVPTKAVIEVSFRML